MRLVPIDCDRTGQTEYMREREREREDDGRRGEGKKREENM